MRQLAIALLFLASQAFGAATNVNLRRLDYTNNVQFGSQQSREMLWYRGESVEYNVDVWRETERVAIPSTASVIWQAWKSNNLTVLYIAVTGQVVSADNGQVRATLTPAQANLASGVYNSALSLWDGTNYIGMAGVGQIRVVWTPAGDALPYVGASAAAYVPKPTNAWAAGYVLASSDSGTTTYAAAQTAGSGSGTLTNILRGGGSSTRLSVSNGAGPQVTLSLDVSGLATGTPLYVEADAAAIAQVGAASNALNAGVIAAGVAATNAGNTAAQAQVLGTNAYALAVTASNLAASAFAGLPSLAALSNGVANAATGAPVYVESDPLWAAVSNLFRVGTNVLADQSGTNLLYNGVGLRDGVGAGGGGSETQALESVLSLGNVKSDLRIVSDDVHIGGATQLSTGFLDDGGAYFAGNVIVGGASNDYEGAWSANTITGAAGSVIIGGAANRIHSSIQTNIDEWVGIGGTMYNGIIASHRSEIVARTSDWQQTKYVGILGVNNMHVLGSSFLGVIGSAGGTISNATYGVQIGASHANVYGPGYAQPLEGFLQWGRSSTITSSFSAVFADDQYNDGAPYSDNGSNTFNIGMAEIWQNRVKLFDHGVPQFAADSLSNASVQIGNKLIVGPNNTIGATATNVSIYGGAGGNVISNGGNNVVVGGSAHNIAGGASSGSSGILSGTNNAIGATVAVSVIAGGRQNKIGSSSFYAAIVGGHLNGFFGGADYAFIGGGENCSNDTLNATHTVLGGGHLNKVGAKYAAILGGASNTVRAVGGVAIGTAGSVVAGATNSIVLSSDPLHPATNTAPNSVLIAGRGGLQLAALNSVPWEVGGMRFVTNIDVTTVAPLRQGSMLYDVGSNALYIAESATTNEWQKITP